MTDRYSDKTVLEAPFFFRGVCFSHHHGSKARRNKLVIEFLR